MKKKADSLNDHLPDTVTSSLDPIVLAVESATEGFPQILVNMKCRQSDSC